MTILTPIFDCQKLMVGYKSPCTHPISFTIREHGLYALSGPNGSGKSTFLKTLVGLIKPLSGFFCVKTHQKFSYVPQVYAVNQYFHLSMHNFILQGYGPNFKMNKKTDETVTELIKAWQLEEFTQKCFHELSGGQKTRAMIIRALISNPNTLFLDEPLANLDSCCQDQLLDTLTTLIHQKKICVFLADHHLEKYSNYITGRLIFEKKHDDRLTFVNAFL